MAEVRFTVNTPLRPETVVAALTDFSQRRPEIWADLDPEIYRVDELGATFAVVREGQRSPRLWAIEEYDWSTPGTVTWTVRESNFCRPGSFMSATVAPSDSGGSRVGFRWNRRGTGLKGKMIVALMRLTKGRPLVAALARALAQLEPSESASAARSGTALGQGR